MALPSIRVQFAFGNPGPLQPPNDIYIPGSDTGSDITTSGGTIAAWQNEIDIRLDIQSDTWTPTNTQDICRRFASGTSTSDFLVQIRPSGVLRYTKRIGGGLGQYESPKTVRASDGDRVTIRITQRIQALSGTDYMVIAFYQARGAGLFPEDDAWESLGSQWTTDVPLSASGEAQIDILDSLNAGEDTRIFGASWATTIGATPILGLPQPIPTGQTTFTDEYSAGTTWGTAADASEALAPWQSVPDGELAEASWTAGRTDELATLQSTRATIVLHNENRQWDPDNTASPYRSGGVTQLLPRVPVRIQTDTGAGWITQWTGFVEGGWDQRPDHPASGVAVVECVDLVAVTADIPINRDRLQDIILRLAPVLYMPLDEVLPDGTLLQLGSAAVTATATTDAEEIESVESLLLSRAGRAVSFADTTGNDGIELSAAPLAFPPATFVFWYRADAEVTVRVFLAAGTTAGLGDDEFGFRIPGSGGAQDEVELFNDTGGAANTAVGGADGERHFIAVTIPDTSGRTLWNQDGGIASVSMSGGSFGSIPDTLDWRIGGTFTSGRWNGILDEVVVYDYALDPDQVNDIRVASFATQDVDERYRYLLDSAGVPAALYEIESGTYQADVTNAAYGDRYLLGALGDVANIEQGIVTVDHRAEVLRIAPRAWRATPPAASLTLTDEDTALGATTLRADDLAVVPNGMDTIINVVDVTWGSGDRRVTTTVTDEASVLAYGARSRTLETQAATLAAAEGAANEILSRFAQPRSRVVTATVDVGPVQGATAIAPLLALETDDVVTVRRQPLGVGSVLTASHYVEAVSHRVRAPDDWAVTLTLSPVPS